MTDQNNSYSSRDYRETVFLPQTDFPMRAGLPKLEPEILSFWEKSEAYFAVRARRKADNRPLYVLHDGPPYANGMIHIGHALNKILKDFVVRSRFLLGYDVDYRPGWDCHGLPIEWKIEEAFRAKGKLKGEISKADFRKACRDYAKDWIEQQKSEFKRLGVLGDWGNPYATMDYSSESAIVREFHKFVMSGQVYRGSKPVMWSPVERTALAEAEVEYHDHESPTIWVKFPIVTPMSQFPNIQDPEPRLEGASVVIWTTTPWTIPANRAIAFNPKIAYGVFKVTALAEDLGYSPWARVGERLIIAEARAEEVFKAAGVTEWEELGPVDPWAISECRHPFHELAPSANEREGYGFTVPLLKGDHVTDDVGTGFVHTAPGHGADDYAVWLADGRHEIPDTVDEEGRYYDHVPLFAGLAVLETDGKKSGKFGPANNEVIKKLIEAGALLARGRIRHSYPHSWRSKAPIIFRNTPQWFIRMDAPLAQHGGKTLRQIALFAIDQTDFYPDVARNRLRSMVERRPDWLISRQRAWGTPLAVFVHKDTGEVLRDPLVNERIAKIIEEQGADAWFIHEAKTFLGEAYDPEAYEKIDDILDVWFDAGSTHAFVLEGRENSHWPADLYLEGSDQHRGWFQSSLLEACGTRGKAPFRAVLTHGFTLDEKGEKMSKSKGNVVEPQTLIRESGAEIIRLWAALVDSSEDQRIGKQILSTITDSYRKLRNSLRYLLGALEGFSENEEALAPDQMAPLELYILHKLWENDREIRKAYESYRFSDVWRLVTQFCAQDLSAFYFDIRKDSLYCDRRDHPHRRGARTVMAACFERLTAWLSPLTPFTTEEAWQIRYPNSDPNLFREIPLTPESWQNPDEKARWQIVRAVLDQIQSALEAKREAKEIGSGLEAKVTLSLSEDAFKAFQGIEAADVFRVSLVDIRTDATGPETSLSRQEPFAFGILSLDIEILNDYKCARCWKLLPEVLNPSSICHRCEEAVALYDQRQNLSVA